MKTTELDETIALPLFPNESSAAVSKTDILSNESQLFPKQISRTTQCTNTGQVSACSQEPEDSTAANIVETSTCLKTIR